MWRSQHGLIPFSRYYISSTSKTGRIAWCCGRPFASASTAQEMSNQGLKEELAQGGGQEQPQGQTGLIQDRPNYSAWDTSSLIARITELERQLYSQTAQLSSPARNNSPTATEPVPPSTFSTLPESHSPTVSANSNSTTERRAAENASSTGDITHTRAPGRPAKKAREIDPARYHTRFIALKFSYLGQRYNGFEHANGNVTPLPTIEEELWRALRRTRLILPPADSSSDDLIGNGPRRLKPYVISWDGCQYSKAGRTDRGVSAFGQVIGIRVRSARPKSQESYVGDEAGEPSAADSNWDDVADEIPYIQILNRVLPEDIRIIAWCPHPPENFDARFSCRGRQYKYFFTQPAFAPTPGPIGFTQGSRNTKYREGWLDIDAMRKAAKSFEGLHDFRNFCKVDTSKQLDNFKREIFHADIETVDPQTHTPSYVGNPGFEAFEGCTKSESTAQVYAFSLRGSAFLWHQVRHMIGVLFLIGQGLESPSIIPELLDISRNPCRPTYEMASDAPLVLWDCIFPDKASGEPENAVEWVYAGDPRMPKSQGGGGKFGIGGVVDDLWTVWRQRKMDEILAGALLDSAVNQGDQISAQPDGPQTTSSGRQPRGQRIFFGGNEGKLGGKYVQVMQKRKMDPVEVLNARWRANKQRKKTMDTDSGMS